MKLLPALKASLLLAVGIAAGRWLDLPPIPVLVLASSLLVPALFVKRFTIADLLVAVTLLSAGAAGYLSRRSLSELPTVTAAVNGVIAEPIMRLEEGCAFPVRTARIEFAGDALKCRGLLWVRCETDLPRLEVGDRLLLRGRLQPYPQQRNPGDFDLASWRRRNGYLGGIRVAGAEDITRLDDKPSPLFRIRRWILRSSERFGGGDADIYKALLLGFRRELDPGLRADLQRTGLSHLLALSGLHVGFLLAVAFGLGALLRLPPSGRAVTALCCVLLFAVLVPLRASTLRAAVMAVTLLGGLVIKRWSPLMNSLGLAALVILTLRPGELFDAGFQLSFAAAAGIILYQPLISETYHRGTRRGGRFNRWMHHWVLTPFLVSTVAFLATMPLTSYHFTLVPFGAPLYNLVAVPLVGLIFVGAWLTVLTGALWGWLASLFADGVTGLILVWRSAAHIFALQPLTWEVRLAPLSVGLLFAVLIWAVVGRGKTATRFTLATLAIAALFIWDGLLPRQSRFQAWFLDVGHGDCALYLFPDGRTMIVDGGPHRKSSYDSPAVGSLKALGRRRVDLMVASHPEADHIGGLIEVVRSLPVREAVTSPFVGRTQTYRTLMEASRQRGITWRTLSAGDGIDCLPEGYTLKVAGPPPDIDGWSANDASLVLLLTVPAGRSGRAGLLTTGDVERRGETALVAGGKIAAELLKVPHHGSPTSSSPEFIAAVEPQVAVISQMNLREALRFRSIDKVVERLQNAGVELHFTFTEGAILLEPVVVDGMARWASRDWRQPRFFPWLLGRM